MFLCVRNGLHQFLFIRRLNYLPCTRLKDRVAVVTASTAGIGFAIAKRLGLEGAKVSISSRNQTNIDRALAILKDDGTTAMGTICDFTKNDHRKQLLEVVEKEFGGIDILVPNCTKYIPLYGMGEEKDWDEIFYLNLKIAYLLTKEAMPIMTKKPASKIVYISSIASYNGQDTFSGPYSIAKTGIIGLTKMVSWQLAQKGVNVNAVAPGLVDTMASVIEDEAMKKRVEDIPLKRYGTANDVAAGVAFLASDDASYVSGEVLVIGGGMTSRL